MHWLKNRPLDQWVLEPWICTTQSEALTASPPLSQTAYVNLSSNEGISFRIIWTVPFTIIKRRFVFLKHYVCCSCIIFYIRHKKLGFAIRHDPSWVQPPTLAHDPWLAHPDPYKQHCMGQSPTPTHDSWLTYPQTPSHNTLWTLKVMKAELEDQSQQLMMKLQCYILFLELGECFECWNLCKVTYYIKVPLYHTKSN